MATDANSLLAEAKCYECNTSAPYGLLLVQLGLWRQVLLLINPMADTSPNALLNEAKCYECYSASPYMLQLIGLGLLKQIAEGGGTGGSDQITQGNGAPVAPPADPTKSAIYIRLDTGGTLYSWNVTTQAWI